MDLMDFQAWVYSNIEVNPHTVDCTGSLIVGVKLFGMPHTVVGEGGENGGVFYLSIEKFDDDDNEVAVSSRQVKKLGSIEEALRMRIVELFVSSLEYERKKRILCDFNRFFAGGLSLFESVREKSPQAMSAKELISSFNEKFESCEKSIKKEKVVKHAIKDLKESVESFSRLLQKRIEKKLEALNE